MTTETRSPQLETILRAISDPKSVTRVELSEAINSLPTEDIAAAEQLSGADPSKRDRTYPTTHLHSVLMPGHALATASVGHEQRLARAKELLEHVATSDRPDKIKEVWRTEIDNLSLTNPQRDLLERDLGETIDKAMEQRVDRRLNALRATGETLPPVVNGKVTLPNLLGHPQSRSWDKGSVGRIQGQLYKVTKVERGNPSSRTFHVTPATEEEYANRAGKILGTGEIGQAIQLKSGEWFHIKASKRAAVREDAGMGEVVGYTHWLEGNFVPADKASKLNAKWAKTPAGRIKRIGEIAKQVRHVDHHKDQADTQGLTQIAGFGRQTLSGSERLYSDGQRIVLATSSYDDGPHYWEVSDKALAKELLEHHEKLQDT